MCGCLSSVPYWGPGPHPRHVPWLGIEPTALWFAALAQSTEPHQPGLLFMNLKTNLKCRWLLNEHTIQVHLYFYNFINTFINEYKKTCNTEPEIEQSIHICVQSIPHPAVLGHTMSNRLTSKAWLELLRAAVHFRRCMMSQRKHLLQIQTLIYIS